jgi:enoyl-CoA hydratase/carnithine racemase
MSIKDIEIRNLYEALKAAEYYIDRLEAAAQRRRVRDMTEAMEHYHHSAKPVIAAFDKEFS